MDQRDLQVFIPAFMVVFFGTVSAWSYIRKHKRVPPLQRQGYRVRAEAKLVDFFFKVLMVMSLVLAMVYSFFPEYYYLAGPIEWLDIPVINTIGALVLKVSLVWAVMAQFNIERTIGMINAGVEQASFGKLLSYAQRLILTGFVIMFLGLFITISSVVAMLISTFAALLFLRAQRSLS